MRAVTGKDLFPGEVEKREVRRHAIVLAKPSLAPFAAIALFAGFPNGTTLLILVFTFAAFAWKYALWRADRFVLTTDRILSTQGIFNRRVESMPLAKVTDVAYERSLPGRLLGYGALRLESAGQEGLERIDRLSNPDDFYRTLMYLALGDRVTAAQADE